MQNTLFGLSFNTYKSATGINFNKHTAISVLILQTGNAVKMDKLLATAKLQMLQNHEQIKENGSQPNSMKSASRIDGLITIYLQPRLITYYLSTRISGRDYQKRAVIGWDIMVFAIIRGQDIKFVLLLKRV